MLRFVERRIRKKKESEKIFRTNRWVVSATSRTNYTSSMFHSKVSVAPPCPKNIHSAIPPRQGGRTFVVCAEQNSAIPRPVDFWSR